MTDKPTKDHSAAELEAQLGASPKQFENDHSVADIEAMAMAHENEARRLRGLIPHGHK